VKYAYADGTRARFFERFDLAEAYEGGEFVALADYAFGGSRASGHGSADNVLRYFAKIGFQFRVSGF
jgi:hypothetical protein